MNKGMRVAVTLRGQRLDVSRKCDNCEINKSDTSQEREWASDHGLACISRPIDITIR